METIRAFIAVELSDEVKKALAKLQFRLKSGSRAPVKWTDPEGTHLTLVFFGNVNATQVAPITDAMQAAVRGVHPFRLEASGLGVFPNPNRVRVVWVGLKGDVETLIRLQKHIEESVRPLGFTPEVRAFTPHLTLGRVREEARNEERQGLGQIIAGIKESAGAALEVKAVHLFRSQLKPTGAVYSKIATIELK